MRRKDRPEARRAVSSASPDNRPNAKRQAIKVAIGNVKTKICGSRDHKYSRIRPNDDSDSEIILATPLRLSTEKKRIVKAPSPKKKGLRISLRM